MDTFRTAPEPPPAEYASSQSRTASAKFETRLLANQQWTLPGSPKPEDEVPNPFADHPAIENFLSLYTGKQRKNSREWLDYFTSDCFLDAAWDLNFTALLLEHVTRLEAEYPVNREFLNWLCAAYQFTVTRAVYLNPDGSERTEYHFQISSEAQFDGQDSIFEIAMKGPAPRQLKGNELAILYSFQEYRRLTRMADNNIWGEEQKGMFSQIVGRYAARYITDKCRQRGDMDYERHPAGLRLIACFCRRDGLPEELYRIVWQKLDLKTAVMGRAKLLWGPLRDTALAHVPELDNQPRVSFAKLRTDFRDYAVSTYKTGGENARATQSDIKKTDAFFARQDFQQALLDRRFVEEEILHTWVDMTCCDYYLKTVIRFYTEHETAPCAKLVIERAKEMLKYQKLADRLKKDREAESLPGSLTLKSGPFFRHWLNTGFYQARDPKSGIRLLQYLNQKLPFLPEWSKKFLDVKENEIPVPRVTVCTLEGRAGTSTKADSIEVRFHLRYMEFLLNGAPVYRPCLSWEQVTALADTDTFFFLLPVTAAPCGQYDQAVSELSRRLADTAAPKEDREVIAACLAGQVCRLSLPVTAKPESDFENCMET